MQENLEENKIAKLQIFMILEYRVYCVKHFLMLSTTPKHFFLHFWLLPNKVNPVFRDILQFNVLLHLQSICAHILAFGCSLNVISRPNVNARYVNSKNKAIESNFP